MNVEIVPPLDHFCKDVTTSTVAIGDGVSWSILAPRQVNMTLTSTSTELTVPPPTVLGSTPDLIADGVVISISSTTTLFPEPPPTPVQLPGVVHLCQCRSCSQSDGCCRR
jgi:hypothetical protein